MKKTKITKEIVGEKLKDYGFSFLKSSGIDWEFIRKVPRQRYYDPENQMVEQHILIQESRFDKSLTVRLCTDVTGYEYDRTLEELEQYENTGWVSYLDEDSYKEKLELLAEMTIKYGLDMLEKMSHEEEIIPTKAMAEDLFANHAKLAHDFIEEYQIKAEPERLEDVDEWFALFKQLMLEKAEQPYAEVQELLTKIAAFIAEKSCEICDYTWLFPAHFKAPEIIGKPYNFLPLERVVNAWKNKCEGSPWKLMEEQWTTLKNGVAKKIT